MLIDKNDIEKAKEKLGVQNAYLMAELLKLENFDEKNLKACCPYHNEDTPSFIYNKKNYTWHCFGCNQTVDLIDVLMEKGSTFLEASQYLFEKANIEYSFGEKNVKTKRDYRYPKDPSIETRENATNYLNKRGISNDVIDYLDISEDEKGNCVLKFYDTSDVLTMVKLRPSHSVQKPNPKTWVLPNSDSTPLLFNMNRVNISKPLLITEGEIDCASCIEAGYLNTVSIPLGCQNTHWIEENYDWLEQFDNIILWFDGDSPGIKARKECINRLGSWKSKYIETPEYILKNDKKILVKDANDVLQMAGKEYVLKLINDAKDIPVDGVVDYADVEEADMTNMEGVTIGIKPLDDELGKLYFGTLTIITGKAGSGKTSLVDQIIGHAIDDDIPVFLYSQEMQTKVTTNWLNHIMAGRRNLAEKINNSGEKYYVVPYEKRQQMQNFYRQKLYMYEDDQSNNEDVVLEKLEGCIRKYGVRLAIIDNLMGVLLNSDSQDKNEQQTAFINRLIRLAAKYNIAIILVSHPRKGASGMTSDNLTLDDIAGSSNIGNLAHRTIGLRRITKKEKEDPKCKLKNFDVLISCLKDRMMGKLDCQVGVFYDTVSRRFYTNYNEFDWQYSWDQNKYFDKLPYVDRNSVTEASPFN